MGKSTLLTEIACRISKGEALPGATGALIEAGSTIYITTENPAAECLRPRVLACGGDPSKIFHLQNVLIPTSKKVGQPRIFDITRDLPALVKDVERIGDVRMVVIDPAISHLHEKIDPNATAQVRHVMDVLAEFANKYRVAVVLVMHNAKGLAESAAKKIAGSHQWVDAARAAFGVTMDPNDPTHERRFLSRLKANIYVTHTVLAFHIKDSLIKDPKEPDPDAVFKTTYVEWEGEDPDVDAEGLFNPDPSVKKERPESQMDRAVGILHSLIVEGVAEVPAALVMEMDKDVSIYTWCRARTAMGMKKPEQRPDGWWWRF